MPKATKVYTQYFSKWRKEWCDLPPDDSGLSMKKYKYQLR